MGKDWGLFGGERMYFVGPEWGELGGKGGGEREAPLPLICHFTSLCWSGGGSLNPFLSPLPKYRGTVGPPLSGAPFLPPPSFNLNFAFFALAGGGLLINRKNWGLKFDEFRAEIPILMPGGGRERGGKGGGNLRRISSGFAVFPPRGFNTAISTSGASLMIRNIY